MADINPEIMKAVPGAAGALVSMLFIKDTWPRRIAMFLAGSALSFWGTSWAVRFTGLDAGFAGFLLGCFGMAVVAKCFDIWSKFDGAALFMEAVRKVLGLPPKDVPSKEI